MAKKAKNGKNGKNGNGGIRNRQSERIISVAMQKIREGWCYRKTVTYIEKKYNFSNRWSKTLVRRAEDEWVTENESKHATKVASHRARLFKFLNWCEKQAINSQKETETIVERSPGRAVIVDGELILDEDGNIQREILEKRVVKQKIKKLPVAWAHLRVECLKEIAKLDGLNRPDLFEGVMHEEIKIIKIPMPVKKLEE